ncbi:sodium-dependent phosphate transport protein 4 isoform X4 [Megachile rotundata]|uniref:sodium-dependent phosphate transport protein 4 isoform X4 n=1 Tax=Megachile rotundata TaxID=143995 RepID=UPI0006150E45|nr:PREDICTED: sodium-dependent phosphate transport protein 4 isoform X4 [Megachile rotundata]
MVECVGASRDRCAFRSSAREPPQRRVILAISKSVANVISRGVAVTVNPSCAGVDKEGSDENGRMKRGETGGWQNESRKESRRTSRDLRGKQRRIEESQVIFLLPFRRNSQSEKRCRIHRDMVPARVVLYMLSFSGFTVSFMMRNDINIAMVAMVKPPSSTSDTNVPMTSHHCYVTPNVSLVNNSTPIRLEGEIYATAEERSSPRMNRTRAKAKPHSRFSFGIGITYPLCGFIIAHFGWRAVFYTTGSIGMLWCLFWYFFAFDTPASHPRISQQELRYIQGSVGNQVHGTNESMPVPWGSILRSWPAWSIGITTFGRIWVHYIFIISGPMYMKTVLGFSIQANGVLSGLPFICSYFSSVAFCYVADVLVTRQILSLTNVRKVFTALSQVVPGIMLVLIGYLGCDIVLVLVVWFIAVTLITAAYAGAMANIVDIAPNFAGPILAFAQTIHMSASFLSPVVAGLLTQKSQALDAWRQVFGVTACVACATYVVYQICGTGDIQAWNYPDQKYPQSVQEDSQPLNESPQKNGKIVKSRSNVSAEA